jgi:hypothetical protein
MLRSRSGILIETYAKMQPVIARPVKPYRCESGKNAPEKPPFAFLNSGGVIIPPYILTLFTGFMRAALCFNVSPDGQDIIIMFLSVVMVIL